MTTRYSAFLKLCDISLDLTRIAPHHDSIAKTIKCIFLNYFSMWCVKYIPPLYSRFVETPLRENTSKVNVLIELVATAALKVL